MFEAQYPVPPRGLATAFNEAEIPISYAAEMTNRLIGGAGGAEKRPGLTIQATAGAGIDSRTSIHELVKGDGTRVLFMSAQGSIYKYDDVSTFSSVYSFATASAASADVRSVQMNDKLIFCNGVDANVYTKDGTTFTQLQALIEQGTITGAASANGFEDSNFSNWIAGTDVAINDLVHNANKGAYAIITAVNSANIVHTAISAAARGIGIGSGDPATTDAYEIIDLVELNVVPTLLTNDNVGKLIAGTTTTKVIVSGVSNWANTELRKGDFIYNTTRAAVTIVTSVGTTDLDVTAIAAQVANDSVALFKSAMPLTSFPHVHYGRFYAVDSRDMQKIRISGANDPQDMTSDAGTLESVSFQFGGLQPKGDTILALASFQSFFIMVGRQNVYVYQGIDPIPVSALQSTTDFTPVALYPQGGVSPDGVISIGNDVLFMTRDGIQAISQDQYATSLTRNNISEAIRTTIRAYISSAASTNLSLTHYPQRALVLARVGVSAMYCYNYQTFVGEEIGQTGAPTGYKGGSWSFFNGPFAQQNDYFLRQNGVLMTCNSAGQVFAWDQGGFTDNGTVYPTSFKTAWLSLEEPRKTVRHKQLIYIKPIIQAGADIEYTIAASAPFSDESSDSVTFTASAGESIHNIKYPLRAKGEVLRLTYTTSSASGPDVISRYSLYANMRGRK